MGDGVYLIDEFAREVEDLDPVALDFGAEVGAVDGDGVEVLFEGVVDWGEGVYGGDDLLGEVDWEAF